MPKPWNDKYDPLTHRYDRIEKFLDETVEAEDRMRELWSEITLLDQQVKRITTPADGGKANSAPVIYALKEPSIFGRLCGEEAKVVAIVAPPRQQLVIRTAADFRAAALERKNSLEGLTARLDDRRAQLSTVVDKMAVLIETLSEFGVKGNTSQELLEAYRLIRFPVPKNLPAEPKPFQTIVRETIQADMLAELGSIVQKDVYLRPQDEAKSRIARMQDMAEAERGREDVLEKEAKDLVQEEYLVLQQRGDAIKKNVPTFEIDQRLRKSRERLNEINFMLRHLGREVHRTGESVSPEEALRMKKIALIQREETQFKEKFKGNQEMVEGYKRLCDRRVAEILGDEPEDDYEA